MPDLRAATNGHKGLEQPQRASPIYWGTSDSRFKSCQPDSSEIGFELRKQSHLWMVIA